MCRYKILFCIIYFIYELCIAETNDLELYPTPYVHRHGSGLTYRAIQNCPELGQTAVPHELYSAHQPEETSSSFVNVKRFMDYSGGKAIRGHVAIVSDPLRTVSILEPNDIGGCSLNQRQTVAKTAKQKNCLVAINAGYFNTSNGECLGNIVSDGRKVHDSHGIQNAHFGIKKDGKLFIGYVPDEEFQNDFEDFQQLVGGVIWLVRNNSNFVNTSKYLECESTEETGPMDQFVEISSARTAVGHDSRGRVVIVHVDGKSRTDGISLLDFQGILLQLGVVNAINLDGGGSSTFIINGTVVNYPSDECSTKDMFTCERKVSTVLCVHPPECDPIDCSGHGQCIVGKCSCNPNWLPPACNQLSCSSNNCSDHGICTEGGCVCEPGFYENCNKTCPLGWYGLQCHYQCNCSNDSVCDPVNGICKCSPDVAGSNCSKEITDATLATKLADNEGSKKLKVLVVVLSVITAVSLGSSLILIFYSCSCRCASKPSMCTRNKKPKYKDLRVLASALALSESSDSDSISLSIVDKR